MNPFELVAAETSSLVHKIASSAQSQTSQIRQRCLCFGPTVPDPASRSMVPQNYRSRLGALRPARHQEPNASTVEWPRSVRVPRDSEGKVSDPTSRIAFAPNSVAVISHRRTAKPCGNSHAGQISYRLYGLSWSGTTGNRKMALASQETAHPHGF